eukprot:Awhi_evm1s11892
MSKEAHECFVTVSLSGERANVVHGCCPCTAGKPGTCSHNLKTLTVREPSTKFTPVLFKSHIAHCNGMEKTKKVELQNEYFNMILDRDYDNSDRNPNKYFDNSDSSYSSSSSEDDSGDDSDDSDIDDKNT